MKALSLIILFSVLVCLSQADQGFLGFIQEYVCDHIKDFKFSEHEHPEMFAVCHKRKRQAVVEDMITAPSLKSGHHPLVQGHAMIWYKNWITCTFCKTSVTTFRKLATDPLYVNSLQGFAWFLCSTQFSQSFCKFYVAQQVTSLDQEIFPVMLSQEFFCGYLFDLCSTNYYTELTTLEYEEKTVGMASKPSKSITNSFLDKLYSNPKLSPDFKLLWLSDIDIDLNYVYESSINCADVSCCHAHNIPVTELDLAPLYGHINCNLPIDGFYKMIDTLNALNNTQKFSFNSVLYGGSGNAVNPEQLKRDQVIEVHTELIKYFRSKNDYIGIYHALGPHDVYPIDYQLFGNTAQALPLKLWNPGSDTAADVFTDEKTTATALLSDINTAIHPDGVVSNADSQIPSKYSSISSDSDAQTSFKLSGYYKRRPVIYMQSYDGSSPQKATRAYAKADLNLISLNTNACHNRNFALMRERSDPGGQLAWLITQLKLIETDQQVAWIIGNVNPGSKYCNSRWSRRYNSIINRFQAIVRAQFFGHEAEEYFQLQFPSDSQSQNPFGVTFQGASASSLGHNPQFKILYMDYSSYIPRKIITYEFDLAAVNANPNAPPSSLIKKIREMPADLNNASSLRPFDLYAFISKLNVTEQVAIDFNNKFCPSQDTGPTNTCRISTCGTICRHNMACKLGNASAIDIMACRQVGLQDVDYGLEYMISLLENPWVHYCEADGAAPCTKGTADTYSYYSN